MTNAIIAKKDIKVPKTNTIINAITKKNIPDNLFLKYLVMSLFLALINTKNAVKINIKDIISNNKYPLLTIITKK